MKIKLDMAIAAFWIIALAGLILLSDKWNFAIGLAFVMACGSILWVSCRVLHGMSITERDNDDY